MINRIPLATIRAAREVLFESGALDHRAMAIAVVDEAAGLVYAERMEDCHARVLVHAHRKAYTAATMRRDTLFFRDQNAELAKSLADWGDSMLTQLPGGVALGSGQDWWGGVGVGGNTEPRDIELARLVARLLLDGTG
jgi:uncharacterized protein GlcG (DUF336 family)